MKHQNLQIFAPSTVDTAPQDATSPRTQRELDLVSGLAPQKRVSMPLSAVAAVLLEAAQNNRAWTEDFGEDLIEMDSDLYEVLMAYRKMQTSEAA